ncbi:MAG: hypothetical protein FWH22_10185 [Fibromonadales bacterium]|nr:hypothetical protein [Fibromonadales bacterium]
MKTYFKSLISAALVALLACNNSTDSTSSGEDIKNPFAKQVPPVLVVADDVKTWIDEQLATGSSEKKLVFISDMYIPDIESISGLYATYSNEIIEYFLNGNKITAEEYTKIWEDYNKNVSSKNKRDLSIPGEIISGISDERYSWTVLITAEELSELLKTYDLLSIEFYRECTNEAWMHL